MSIQAPAAPAHVADHHVRDADHAFLPDFAWAAVGGAVTLVVCALVIMLAASWGTGPAISAYARELAGGFLAGFLVTLVARSLTARTR